MDMPNTRSAIALRHTRPLIAAAAVLALASLFLTSSAQSAARKAEGRKPTIVLVHGAWADASGWNDVFMANRANATIEEVKSSHVATISHPEAVTKLIETAVKATS
jgi:hypothetical protein